MGHVEHIQKDKDNNTRYMVKCIGKRIVELSKEAPENIIIEEQTRVAIEPKSFKVFYKDFFFNS